MGFLSRSDPQCVVGPVQYLADALVFIDAADFETSLDDFLRRVADDGRSVCSDHRALVAQFRALKFEREDSELSAWRRMEARLGFDVDEAPPPTPIAKSSAMSQMVSRKRSRAGTFRRVKRT